MRAILTVTIDYDDACIPTEEIIEDVLLNAVSHLAGNGLLSDDNNIVDNWDAEVAFARGD